MEDERREFDAFVATLPSSSRLFRLITFIGDKYFKSETDQLHEYNIATEVFGRSKTTFDAGQDAIVRVEAHRLRKRLKEYYESEGKDHHFQLLIPPGTYAPVFTRLPLAVPEGVEPGPEQAKPPVRLWISGAVTAGALLLLLACLGVYRILHEPHKAAAGAAPLSTPPSNPQSASFYASMPVRIIAGYDGKPQIDSAGAIWQPDTYFGYGGTWEVPGGFVARTSDPMLFRHWRTGDFIYQIPLRPGIYELHLFFVAGEPPTNGGATFSVAVNGKNILTGFDVASDALGAYIADERIFRDISPASDGLLHLSFTSERGAPALNAIEILPGIPKQQLPIRLVMQPTSFTDHNGQFWHPDNYYMDGYTSSKSMQIAGTADPDIFADERYGHFTYAIPVDTRDRYTLILHFAEFYFGPSASGTGGIGSRVFRVLCNGNTLLDDFDIYKEAGSLHALTKTFYHLKPTAQGKLNITFEPIRNNATISGIEVIDESQ